jgi:hypothetical protein
VESKLGPLGTSATNWPIVPAPGDCEDGEFGGMKIGRGNRSTRRKPAPGPLCPPQIPLDQTRARTRAAAVGSQRLTAWAMARPETKPSHCVFWAIDTGVIKTDECISFLHWSFQGILGRCDHTYLNKTSTNSVKLWESVREIANKFFFT